MVSKFVSTANNDVSQRALSKTRMRPRFSVRTLAIFVTLVCAYLGAWEATKRYGVPGHDWDHQGSKPTWVVQAKSPAPFIVTQDELGYGSLDKRDRRSKGHPRRHYVWIFGFKYKLPLESTWQSHVPDKKTEDVGP